MTAKQRAYHLWTVGGTGVGKSKLFEHIIRQDIANWRKTKCGLLLLDWHGSIYDNLMEWLAEVEGLDLPIIPIDLRRDDWVAGYNLLRTRTEIKPSVIVRSLVEAIAYTWNEPSTSDTPRFARFAAYTLQTLLDNGCTIAEAAQLLTQDDFRRAMSENVTDPVIRDEWEKSFRFPKEFVANSESTLNRFNRITEAELLKAMMGQTEISLDLGRALEEGHIILISLATAGGRVSDEAAATFARLLLSDLWQAAKARDIREGVKPFYLFLDEFQELLSPSIGKTLDQARKFGLHLAMANQYPNQLLNAAGYGKALFDSAIANASTKIVFRTEHPENLETLATSIFMGTFNPDEIKHEIWSTKTVGVSEEIREDETESETDMEGGGDGTTTSDSESGRVRDGEEELYAWNRSIANGEHHLWAKTHSRSVTRRHVQIPIFGKELSSREYRSIDEQLFIAMQKLFAQRDRHCCIRLVGTQAPIFLRTADVRRGRAMPRRVERFLQGRYNNLSFYLPLSDALKRIAVRREKFTNQLLRGDEKLPDRPRRRLKG